MFEVLRGIAENMVAVVNTALKCFSGMQHLLLNGEGAMNLRVSGFSSGLLIVYTCTVVLYQEEYITSCYICIWLLRDTS